MRRLPLALTLLALPSCVPVSARGVPLGPPSPSKAPNCPIAYERVAPRDAAMRWREVGVVCLSHHETEITIDRAAFAFVPAYTNAALRRGLEEEACRLGGETVSPVGVCSNGRMSGVEIGIYAQK